MIFKRILSNIIDALCFLIVFFILFKLSGLEIETSHLYYFYFISFFVTFIFPVILIKNTIGKSIVKLHWTNDESIKLKLGLKYTLYYLAMVPSFSITSALTRLPFFNTHLGEFDKIISATILVVYLFSDIVIFIVSVGKYHISDYILNLSIAKFSYKKKPFMSLGIIYLFFGTLFIVNIYLYKYNISFSSISNTLGSIIYKEQYPSDLYCGSKVFTLKDNSQNVFSPSKPLTFLYIQKVPQKTLFVNLPEKIFNSEHERKKLCLNLIKQSQLNDIFSDFRPRQTRIVLSYFKRGYFLEYYNYLYIYYFDNELPEWNIYGGIEADSTTMKEYINFKYNHNIGKIYEIENKLNLTWDEIVLKSEKNKDFEKEVMNLFSSNLNVSTFYDRLEIKLDTSLLTLRKIDFSETKLYGEMNFNFPITGLEQRVNLVNLIYGEVIEYDENVDYLMLLRKEITNEGL